MLPFWQHTAAGTKNMRCRAHCFAPIQRHPSHIQPLSRPAMLCSVSAPKQQTGVENTTQGYQTGEPGKQHTPGYPKTPPTPGSGEPRRDLGRTRGAKAKEQSRHKERDGRGWDRKGGQEGNTLSCKVPRIVCVPPAAHRPPAPKPAEQRAPPKSNRVGGKTWPNARHPRDSTPQPRPRPGARPQRAAAPRRGAGTAWGRTRKGKKRGAGGADRWKPERRKRG